MFGVRSPVQVLEHALFPKQQRFVVFMFGGLLLRTSLLDLKDKNGCLFKTLLITSWIVIHIFDTPSSTNKN